MLQIHNSLTGRKEAFTPIVPGEVRMYVCGMTVYDYCHLGHARMLIAFDVVRRHLVASGYRVTFVRNITDIDDKIIARANENGEPMAALTERYIRAYHEDCEALGVLRADLEPRATEYLPQIIEMIGTLVAKGHAYAAENGDVYYSVSSFPQYGQLSGKRLADLRAGARIEVDEAKRDPLDFVLWKASKPGEPSWESPWGPGRPGWHIECSAMSVDLLGPHFDLHGGGMDLKFPHHENEIAQTCAACDSKFVNVWMHNGFVRIDDEKMSKSLGNFFTVRDMLDQGHAGETLRLVMLQTHYRQPLDWRAEGIARAKETLDRFYLALRGAPVGAAAAEPRAVVEALLDDLNTPSALSALHADLAALNKAATEPERASARARLVAGGALLGLLQAEPEAWLRGTGAAASAGLDDAAIEALIAGRNAARKAKDFKESDRIRDDLEAKGVILEDGPKGTTWKRG